MATIKKANPDRHRKDSELYFLKKKSGRKPTFRTNNAKEFTVRRVMAGRQYIKISASTLNEILSIYDSEKLRIKKMKELDKTLFE